MDVVWVCRGRGGGVIGTRSVDTGVNSALMIAQKKPAYEGLVTVCDLWW